MSDLNSKTNKNNSNSLWIGEIDIWMDEKFIIDAFKYFNKIVKSVKLMRDKNTGNNIGYGFVEFESQSEALTVIKELNGKQIPNSNGKVFKLNIASYSQNKTQNSNSNINEYSIYVCELSPNINEEILKQFFSQYYTSVIGAKIIVNPLTKISKGYGFVKFTNENEYQRALIEMQGKPINGKPMKINKAVFKKNNPNSENKNFYYKDNNNNIPLGIPANMLNNMMFQQDMINSQNFLLQQQYPYMNNGFIPGYINPMLCPMFYAPQVEQVQNNNITNNEQDTTNKNEK